MDHAWHSSVSLGISLDDSLKGHRHARHTSKDSKAVGQQMPLSTLFWPDIPMSHLRIAQSRKTMQAVQWSESGIASSGNADLLEHSVYM